MPSRLFPALLFAIVLGTLMPGEIKDQAHSLLGPQLPWPAVAHFVLFALLGSMSAPGPHWRATGRVLALAVALAIGTELMQTWVPGRHPTLRDVGIDLAGALAGRMYALVRTRLSGTPSTRQTVQT
ncbi:VanZ family protein [Ramlibacter rhizophilus]|nr:VanZ family protein [Ramlibacter rhizophilus]